MGRRSIVIVLISYLFSVTFGGTQFNKNVGPSNSYIFRDGDPQKQKRENVAVYVFEAPEETPDLDSGGLATNDVIDVDKPRKRIGESYFFTYPDLVDVYPGDNKLSSSRSKMEIVNKTVIDEEDKFIFIPYISETVNAQEKNDLGDDKSYALPQEEPITEVSLYEYITGRFDISDGAIGASHESESGTEKSSNRDDIMESSIRLGFEKSNTTEIPSSTINNTVGDGTVPY